MDDLLQLLQKHKLQGLTDNEQAEIANRKLMLKATLEANPLFKLFMLGVRAEYLELVEETTTESDNIGRNSDDLRYKLLKAKTLKALLDYVNTDLTTTRFRTD